MELCLIEVFSLLPKEGTLVVIDRHNSMLPYAPINNYLLAPKVQQLASRRRKDIAHDLIRFFTWLNIEDIKYQAVSTRDIIRFRDYLISEPDQRFIQAKLCHNSTKLALLHPKMEKAGMVNRVIGAIRGFYTSLIKEKVIIEHPCPVEEFRGQRRPSLLKHAKGGIRAVDRTRKTVHQESVFDGLLQNGECPKNQPLTSKEMQIVIDALGHPQEVLLVCMLLCSLRISDALGRRINDIDWSRRVIRVKSRPDDPADGKIKYGSEGEVPIAGVMYFPNLPEVMYRAYQQYVDLVLRPAKTVNSNNYLFISPRKFTPLGYQNIYRRMIVNKLAVKINYREIGFHTFRHHYATTSIASGSPLEDVQKTLRHRHLSTTIEDYYNPSIQLIADLVKQGDMLVEHAMKTIEYIKDYRKRFCMPR